MSTEESDLQVKCNKFLRDNKIDYFHLEKGRGYKHKFRGKGFPDLSIYFCGKTYYIELKSKDGNLNKNQTEFHMMLKGNNIICDVIDNFEDFITILVMRGILNEYSKKIER